MNKSRTANVTRNSAAAVICQICELILNFVIRTFFIKTLGTEYLGVNGLFTNILTILSFAELGIGNAIIYNLYKPLAQSDKEKIKSLMGFYKKAYIAIGCIVFICGICVIPFLNYLIKDKPDIPERIALLYLLFLINTVISYFFAYKKSIIIADQKNYIVLCISLLTDVLKTVIQVYVLVYSHNYIAYLIIQIVFTFLGNYICSRISNRLYPFITGLSKELDKLELETIISNVKALALYKIGSITLNGTDNVLISAMLGLKDVGLASNYILLTRSCSAILGRITEGFTSSIGNLNATESVEKKCDVFFKILFLTSWIYGFASAGLIILSQQFIRNWIGDEYLLSFSVLFAIVSEFYVKGVHSVAYSFRVTMGYFVDGKWSAVAAAIINLFLSIILCHWLGLAGIFIATPIARIVTLGVIDPILIFQRGFKKSTLEYYLKYILYLFVYICVGLLCFYVLSFIKTTGWLGFIINSLIVLVLFNLCVILIFSRTRMFREILQMIISLIKALMYTISSACGLNRRG